MSLSTFQTQEQMENLHLIISGEIVIVLMQMSAMWESR